ncbi:MAG: hypothetical protein OEV66_03260 [Spirochaetia bacterium]|nr:hypothetical protein [Spirochaetia bacterium]
MDLTIKIWQKESEFVAGCPELDIYTYGLDRQQARERLIKVILFYADTATDMGYKIDQGELIGRLNIPFTWRSESYIN